MPAQDRVRGDQAMATQRSGQPPHEGGEHGPVRPVQAWSWVGAAQDGDLVAQHEELDVLGGGRAAHQQDQPEHLPEDQVQQPQRHAGIMSDQRSPLVSDPGPTSGTPQAPGGVSSCRAGPWVPVLGFPRQEPAPFEHEIRLPVGASVWATVPPPAPEPMTMTS